MTRWPPPTYEIRTLFRAPLEFAFSWCTNFSTHDAKLEGETYQRRIVERSRRRVVYEDLASASPGWRWSRHVVSLFPPDHWHSDSVGSHREVSLDYWLVSKGPDRTELTLRMQRRPTALGQSNPPRREMETALRASWRRFARALERDFRTARRP